MSWKIHSHLQTFLSENIVPVHSASIFCDLSHMPFSSGIHIAKKIDKLGMRSSDTAQIFFEDVRVPCKNLIGEEGKGFTYQMLQFQEERLWGVATGKSLFIHPSAAGQGLRGHSPHDKQHFSFLVSWDDLLGSVFEICHSLDTDDIPFL